jgi:hypothetical protein
MTKPVRSPILGYNHNIKFHGRVFHVQTEDSGMGHSRLFTHLFFEGTILASKRHEYDADSPEDVVRLLMQRLHKAMIKELKEGVHDPRIGGFFAARGETIETGDRPTLVPAAPVAVPPPQAPSIPADDRPLAVSGSIDNAAATARSAAAAAAPAAPAAPAGSSTPAVPSKSAAPAVPARRPVVVVRPSEVKRPPVQVSNSAEGVVVKRNVVINVGGGAAPVQGQMSRGTAAPRPAIPYVVREGSYALPTVSRGSGPVPTPPPPPPESQPLASTRDIRMPWDAPSSGAVEAALRTRAPGSPSERTPAERALGADAGVRTRTPAPPSERTPSERAFAADLITDKSLDEVILEYLSDDSE